MTDVDPVPFFPRLKSTVRVSRFPNYLWVIEGMTGFRQIALPVEVAILSLCDGITSRQNIIDIVNSRCCHGTEADKAKHVVDSVLDRFSDTITSGDGRIKTTPPYAFDDYLYEIQPLKQFPQRLPHPIVMLLTLTNRCNLRCIYCYNDSGYARPHELSTEEWLNVVAQAHDVGVQQIDVSGGEPFCHRGALRIMQDIRRRGMLMEVATNGTMHYTDEDIDVMRGCRVDISLDTADTDTYAEMTGRPFLQRAIENITRFVHEGLTVDIKVCLTNRNFTGIAQLYTMLADIGVHSVGLASYTPSIGGRGGDQLLLSSAMLDTIEEQCSQIQQSPGTPLSLGLARPCWTRKEDIIACNALTHTMIVLPNGDVSPCELITTTPEFMFGNVRHQSIMDIWNGTPVRQFFRDKTNPSDRQCASCALLEQCTTGCFAEKLYRKVPVYGPDPRCRVFRRTTPSTRSKA